MRLYYAHIDQYNNEFVTAMIIAPNDTVEYIHQRIQLVELSTGFTQWVDETPVNEYKEQYKVKMKLKEFLS